MRKILGVLLTALIAVSSIAFADEWKDLINEAYKQMPSKSKRKTRSGRRILQEKVNRIQDIDRRIPQLIRGGDYSRAEDLLKESLSLTIEYYGGMNHIHVAERFLSLGIVYMEAGNPQKAEEAFTWCLNIGEKILGKGSYQLSNVYKFLAIAYYEQDKYTRAAEMADFLLSIYVSKFGPNSAQAEEAKALLKTIYQAQGKR